MQLSFASLHLCLLILAGAVHAAPTPLITRETRIMSRQEAAALTEPTTVQTSNTADTYVSILVIFSLSSSLTHFLVCFLQYDGSCD
jgi:hypothetical protein